MEKEIGLETIRSRDISEIAYDICRSQNQTNELYVEWAKKCESNDEWAAVDLYKRGNDLENATRVLIQILKEGQKSWRQDAEDSLLAIAESCINPKGSKGLETDAVELVELTGLSPKEAIASGLPESIKATRIVSIKKSIIRLNLAKKIFEVLDKDTAEIEEKIEKAQALLGEIN